MEIEVPPHNQQAPAALVNPPAAVQQAPPAQPVAVQPLDLKSSTGNKITHFFETGQGSQYLFTDKGESKRWKSVHGNTGGDDQGIKDWYENCVFVPEGEDYEANAFQFIDLATRKNVALSVNNKKGAFYISEGGKWRLAVYGDAYKVFSKMHPDKKDKPLTFNVSKEPKVGYSVLEYNIAKNGIIKNLHFGSPITKVKPAATLTREDLKNFGVK